MNDVVCWSPETARESRPWRRAVALALLLGAGFLVIAGEGEPEEPAAVSGSESLAQLVALLPEVNPQIRSAIRNASALQQRLPQVRALPDPQLTYGFWPRQDKMADDPPNHRLGVMQMFPGPGKRDLQAQMVNAEVEAALRRVEMTRLQVTFDVRKTYYEACVLERTIAIAKENLDLVRQFEVIARSRFRTGQSLMDVLKAQVEIGKIENDLRSMEAMRAPLRGALNALLNRPMDAVLSLPADLPPEALAPVAAADLAAAQELQANPELAEQAAMVRGAAVGVRMARRERVPDVTLGLEYEADRPWTLHPEGSDMIFASVSVNLPVWATKNRARILEAAERSAVARESRTAVANRLQADWQMVLYRLQDADRRMRLYSEELLPRARQSVEVSRQAYEVGKAGFTDLVDAERVSLDLQMLYEQARRDRAVALAEAEMVAGSHIGPASP